MRLLAGAPGDVAARAQAMREAGRALALDPENAAASNTVLELMVEPPSETPAEVADAVRRSSLKTSQHLALVGTWCYLLMITYTPFFMWMETRERIVGAINGVVLLCLAAWSYYYARADDPSPRHVTGACILNMIALVLISRWFGPFVILPGIACASTVIYALHQRPRWIPLCLALGCGAVVAPLVLQYAGVLAPSYAFSDGGITILPNVTNYPKVATMAALIAAALGIIVAPVVAITSVRRSLAEAEQRLHMQRGSCASSCPTRSLHQDDRATCRLPDHTVATPATRDCCKLLNRAAAVPGMGVAPGILGNRDRAGSSQMPAADLYYGHLTGTMGTQ